MTEKTASEVEAVEVVPEIVHVVRTLAEVSNPTNRNILSADDLNLHLTSYVAAGYALHSTHFLGMSEQGIMTMYVFVKRTRRATGAKKAA